MDATRTAWHTDQFREPMRSTVHLAGFAQRVMGDRAFGTALDAACGAGANIVHLRERLGGIWTGVDIDREVVAFGCDRGLDLVEGDLCALERNPRLGRFDACFSLMALSWLPDYERALQQMMAITSDWVIVSSLFAESDFDAFVRVHKRSDGAHSQTRDEHYNVYSLPRFDHFCRSLGATDVIAEPFEIDIDLPRTGAGMGSWTEQTADGRRLTFSGPVWMPWWFVAIRVGPGPTIDGPAQTQR